MPRPPRVIIKRPLGRPGAPLGNTNRAGSGRTPGLRRRYGTAEYMLARLDRDGHTELAGQVRAGALSAHQAALQVGYRKRRTPLDLVLAGIMSLRPDDRVRVAVEIERLRAAAPAGKVLRPFPDFAGKGRFAFGEQLTWCRLPVAL
jgi:hypothetical protein